MALEDVKIIDCDSHVLEPPDLWTSRLPRWGDAVPHVERNPETGADTWYIGGQPELSVGNVAMAGYPRHFPDGPLTYDDVVEPGAMDPHARLRRLDDFGIYAQVFYPNVGGFGAGSYLRLSDPDLRMDCIRAYNDFAVDWASADPRRLLPMMTVPFWDVEASVAEIRRCAAAGHRGIILGSQPEQFGLPMLPDPRWDPIWEVATDLDLSVNFHIGSGDKGFFPKGYPGSGSHANSAKSATLLFLGNANAIAEVICSGICHRYPHLKFVSVESGVGWIPFLLEALEWQWDNNGVTLEHPEYDLRPSEYFARQVFVCFWFERGVRGGEYVPAGNILYSTDYPHATSMSPGPASTALPAREFVETHYGAMNSHEARRILSENAAGLYHVSI
jgi:predicted TIM-barrel fold metal-dependent hydrolase